MIRIKVRGRLRGDDTVSGTFTVTGFAPDGTTEVFSATGTFTRTRMSA